MKLSTSFHNTKRKGEAYYIVSITPNIFFNYRRHTMSHKGLPIWYATLGLRWLTFSISITLKKF